MAIGEGDAANTRGQRAGLIAARGASSATHCVEARNRESKQQALFRSSGCKHPGRPSQLAASPTLQISHLDLHHALVGGPVEPAPCSDRGQQARSSNHGPRMEVCSPGQACCFPTSPIKWVALPGSAAQAGTGSHHRIARPLTSRIRSPQRRQREQCLGCSRIDQPIPGTPH